MIKNLQVSIIIANNSINPDCEKFLSRCLSSIKKNTSVPYEILVEDGAFIGPSKARNRAAKRASGKYLFFLDYDTEVEKNWLKDVVTYLNRHPIIGGGQLKLLRMDRKNIFDSAGEKLTPFGFLAERAQEAEDKGQFDKVENIFSGKGAAMIVRKDVFQKIGGFDEDYFMYWEEPDLTWRIWKSGCRFVFLPMGRVWHAYGTKQKPVSSHWEQQITYLGCRNQTITIVKNGVGLNGLRILSFVTLAWTGLLFMFLVILNFRKAKAIIRAFLWLVKNHKLLLKKRGGLKKRLGKRFTKDDQWFAKIIVKKGISWYLGKGISYILGKAF